MMHAKMQAVKQSIAGKCCQAREQVGRRAVQHDASDTVDRPHLAAFVGLADVMQQTGREQIWAGSVVTQPFENRDQMILIIRRQRAKGVGLRLRQGPCKEGVAVLTRPRRQQGACPLSETMTCRLRKNHA